MPAEPTAECLDERCGTASYEFLEVRPCAEATGYHVEGLLRGAAASDVAEGLRRCGFKVVSLATFGCLIARGPEGNLQLEDNGHFVLTRIADRAAADAFLTRVLGVSAAVVNPPR